MKKLATIIICGAMLLTGASVSMATNGDNLIGVGPISRSMGGVGVASPQDSISAIFANPAAMCFGAYCPGSEATFSGTIFSPTVDSKADFTNMGMGKGESDSQMDPFKSGRVQKTSRITTKKQAIVIQARHRIIAIVGNCFCSIMQH